MSLVSFFAPSMPGSAFAHPFFAANPVLSTIPFGGLPQKGDALSLFNPFLGRAFPSEMNSVPGFEQARKDWESGKQVGTIDSEKLTMSLTPRSTVRPDKTIEGDKVESEKDTATLASKSPTQGLLSRFTGGPLGHFGRPPSSVFDVLALSPFGSPDQFSLSTPDGITPVKFETEIDGKKNETSMYNTGVMTLPNGNGTFQASGFSSSTFGRDSMKQSEMSEGESLGGKILGEVDDDTVGSIPDSKAYHPSSQVDNAEFDQAVQSEAFGTVDVSEFSSPGSVSRTTKA